MIDFKTNNKTCNFLVNTAQFTRKYPVSGAKRDAAAKREKEQTRRLSTVSIVSRLIATCDTSRGSIAYRSRAHVSQPFYTLRTLFLHESRELGNYELMRLVVADSCE